MEQRAKNIAEGTSPMCKARLVKVRDTKTAVDEKPIERAEHLAGLKGYVINISQESMSGNEIIRCHHDHWQVEASFRMTKHALQARPIFHHKEDPNNAHLTMVFAALAVGRHLQELAGLSLK